VSAQQRHAELTGALAGLSRGERDVLLLVALAEFSHDEVAQALGISYGTVASRLSRARAKLRHSLASTPTCLERSDSMDEIAEVQRLLDPPRGLRQHTARAARHRLMLAAAAPARARGRRLLPAAAAASTAAAAAAVAVAAISPGHGSQPATLTAWTVNRAADHTVIVTLREFRDPQGLQRTLTAAGVPALVQSGPSPCPYPYQAIPGNASLIGEVVRDVREPGSLAVLTIRPDAIPAGTQLDIVFPYSGSDSTVKPARSGPPQSAPAVSPSPPTGNEAPVAHPVAIRLIAANQPRCLEPSPGPSASRW
jgi:DNA-binding CsgD family transcriptional regulator